MPIHWKSVEQYFTEALCLILEKLSILDLAQSGVRIKTRVRSHKAAIYISPYVKRVNNGYPTIMLTNSSRTEHNYLAGCPYNRKDHF